MKHLVFCTLLIATVISACSQKISSAKVPQKVKTAFEAAHPNVEAKWEKEGGDYEASFKEAGSEMSCVLSEKGDILETETDIPVSSLPEAIRNYISEHYKGSDIKEASKIVAGDGVVTYEAEVNKKDLMFDSKGNFLKAVE